MTDALQLACQGWLENIARGDDEALAALYDATVAHTYAIALRIVGDADSAEDVIAETYAQVWRQAPQFDTNRGKALSWVLMICRSRALDQRRSTERRQLRELEQSSAEPLCDERDPADLLDVIKTNDALRTALGNLPEVPRQLLGLAFFRGYSHREIATLTNLPLGTIKAHIRRAQQCLQTALQIEHRLDGDTTTPNRDSSAELNHD